MLPTSLESQSHLGVPALGGGIGAGQGVVVEAVLTFFLVWVVFGTAVDPRGTFKQVAGLAIGLTITIDVLMGGVLTGAAMNPARAFGPQLVGDHWAHFWIWYVGPFAGAVIAASVYELLYLRPPRSRTRRGDHLVRVGSGRDAVDVTRRRRTDDRPETRPGHRRRRVHHLRARLVARAAAAEPELPGPRPSAGTSSLGILFFVAMLSAVLVFGKEKEEATAAETADHRCDDDVSRHDDSRHRPRATPTAGKAVFTSAGCVELPHAEGRRLDRHRRTESRPAETRLRDGEAPGGERRRPDAGLQGHPEREADRRRRRVRLERRRQVETAP